MVLVSCEFLDRCAELALQRLDFFFKADALANVRGGFFSGAGVLVRGDSDCLARSVECVCVVDKFSSVVVVVEVVVGNLGREGEDWIWFSWIDDQVNRVCLARNLVASTSHLRLDGGLSSKDGIRKDISELLQAIRVHQNFLFASILLKIIITIFAIFTSQLALALFLLLNLFEHVIAKSGDAAELALGRVDAGGDLREDAVELLGLALELRLALLQRPLARLDERRLREAQEQRHLGQRGERLVLLRRVLVVHDKQRLVAREHRAGAGRREGHTDPVDAERAQRLADGDELVAQRRAAEAALAHPRERLAAVRLQQEI